MGDLRVGPFVRAIRPDGVAIWTEWSHPCDVTLTVTEADTLAEQESSSLVAHVRTVTVGGRYYALSQLTGLQPATWYNYQVATSVLDPAPSAKETNVQCFRTLDLPDVKNTLRLAYGSCRKLSTIEPDALSAFGSWLVASIEQRESVWPHLLLLIGDQIYADDYVGRRKQKRFHVQPDPAAQPVATQSFEDFALMYLEAWADQGIRQVFAVLPTYMIFDDHEISNGWNTSCTWRAYALQHGFERSLVDGLVAYWVYQGWGNIGMQTPDEHALLTIMQQAAQDGQDVLEGLRTRVRQAVYQEQTLKWHYTIPTVPPLFVADVRSDRPAILDGADPADVAPRIMSQEQMEELRTWMKEHTAITTLLVSSVPAILPSLIGFAEYVMGARPFQRRATGLLRRFGHMLAGMQQKVALRMSFDHWPVFGATWRELVELLATRTSDIIILSGDVHFSYSIKARRTLFPTKRSSNLYQLVASPFKNHLEQRDKRLITGQAWMKRAIYGGLHTALLPLRQKKSAKRVPHDMLFQNVVALVTLSPQTEKEGQYAVQQVYLGVKNEVLEEVGFIDVNG
jgi:phosphodiesterase/alkaline phosphatase D-like protein